MKHRQTDSHTAVLALQSMGVANHRKLIDVEESSVYIIITLKT